MAEFLSLKLTNSKTCYRDCDNNSPSLSKAVSDPIACPPLRIRSIYTARELPTFQSVRQTQMIILKTNILTANPRSKTESIKTIIDHITNEREKFIMRNNIKNGFNMDKELGYLQKPIIKRTHYKAKSEIPIKFNHVVFLI